MLTVLRFRHVQGGKLSIDNLDKLLPTIVGKELSQLFFTDDRDSTPIKFDLFICRTIVSASWFIWYWSGTTGKWMLDVL